MKKNQLWFVALIFLLAACGQAEQPGQSTPSPSSLEEVDLVEPVQVSVSLDDSRAVSQVIPITGGSLTATGADGTTFTLDIPGDALIYETEFTMTPVEVSGMPTGFEPGPGVQLEPEGLSFFNFATLTITPADEIPIDQQVFFGYEADGQNLSLALPEIDSNEIKIQLLHFTGYFVGTGNLENVAYVLPQRGGAVVRELNNRIAELTQSERQRQQSEGRKPLAPEYSSELANLFQEYYDRFVKVYLDIAGEGCSKGRLAIDIYGHYTQLMRKAGLADRIVALDYLALVERVAGFCLHEEYQLCVQDHIVHRMIPVLFGLERQMQLVRESLGLGEESASSSALLLQARQLTENCLNFELEFESTAIETYPSGGTTESRVSAKVPIHFDASTFEFRGEAPLINDFFQVTSPPCSTSSTRGGGTFVVFDMNWSLISPEGDQPGPNSLESLDGQIKDIRLQMGASSSESSVIICPTFTDPGPSGVWENRFVATHWDPATMTLFFGDWDIEGGELFATVEWQTQYTFGTESGSMILYHRPK